MVLLLPCFYSSPGFLSLCSVLFLFSLSGSAGVGSVDGGGMAVLDGGAGWWGPQATVERKHSGGAPMVRNGPFSSLCSDA